MQILEASEESKSLFTEIELAPFLLSLRAIYIFLLFLATVLSQLMESQFINASGWITLYSFFAIQSFIYFFVIFNFDKVELRKYFFTTLALVDGFFILGLAILWGESHPLILLSALFNIVLTGIYVGPRSLYFILFLLLAGLNLSWALLDDLSTLELMPYFSLYNGALAAAGLITSYSHKELFKVKKTIEDQQADIQILQDINAHIIDNVSSALFVVDLKDHILKSNRSARRLFSNIHLEGQSLDVLLPELSVFLNKIDRTESHRIEVEHKNFDGTIMILEVIVSPLYKKPYGLQGSIVLVQNLTEVKTLQEQIKTQEKMAALGAMAAGIAHEIRNPLASISGSVQLLAADKDIQNDQNKKLLSIIIKEIERLNDLITEFLEYVRPPMRTDDPIYLHKIISECIDLIKVNSDYKRIHFELELQAQDLSTGHGDKLKQAFLNILINSCQAMSKTLHPVIKIKSTNTADQKILISIRDNGEGMSRETLSQIFVPFFTTKSKGTGLGLAMTHKILESHGAHVQVTSQIGEGTEFKIELLQRRTS